MRTFLRQDGSTTMACLIALLLLLGSCGGGGDKVAPAGNTNGGDLAVAPGAGGVLDSDDGSIRLFIKAGSLAQPTTVTAREVPFQGLPPAVGDSQVPIDTARAVAVQFGPAGTTFHPSRPARVKIRLPDATPLPDTGDGPGVRIPVGLLYLVSENGTVETPPYSEIRVDPSTGEVTLVADLPHFSHLEWAPLGDTFGLDLYLTGEVLPVQTPFVALVSFRGTPRLLHDISPAYQDGSIGPVIYTDVGDPAPTPITNGRLLRNYKCDVKPGKGTYRGTVQVNYLTDMIAVGPVQDAKLVETRWLVKSHTFVQPVTCFDPVTGSADTRVSLYMPQTDTGGIEGGGPYEFAVNLSAPLSTDLKVSLAYDGTAIDKKDFVITGPLRLPMDSAHFVTIPKGDLDATLLIDPIDDTEVDGDKDLSVHLIDPLIPGLSVDTLPSVFHFLDDLQEPSLKANGLTFFAGPQTQTATVGQNAEIRVSQRVTDGGNNHAVVVMATNRTPDILGEPTLLPIGPGEGSTAVTDDNLSLHPWVAGEGFSSTSGGWNRTVRSLATGVDNLQRFAVPCLSAGTGTVGMEVRDVSDRHPLYALPAGTTELAITCESAPVDPGWIGSIGTDWKPEGFGGYVGPRAGTNNEPEGDPFAAPARTWPILPNREILHLNPARDYALLATNGPVNSSGGLGVFDLIDGTEVTRLQMPIAGALGGLVLIPPDMATPDTGPEWLFFYGELGGWAWSRYDEIGQGWGISRFFPGGLVTDIVPGPVDSNGFDTGFIVVNNADNSIEFGRWDPVQNWWGPVGSRTSGAWSALNAKAVSAVGGFDGKALVLVENPNTQGQLWAFDPRETGQNHTDSLVGTVGAGPRRIRCLSGVCVVTNHNSDSITTVAWATPQATPSIVATQAVGAGPVGIDLIPDPAGTGVLALTTGFNGNDFTVTRIGADAQVLESAITPMTGCLSPGFGHFTDGDGTHVMISCRDSNRVVIVPR